MTVAVDFLIMTLIKDKQFVHKYVYTFDRRVTLKSDTVYAKEYESQLVNIIVSNGQNITILNQQMK